MHRTLTWTYIDDIKFSLTCLSIGTALPFFQVDNLFLISQMDVQLKPN